MARRPRTAARLPKTLTGVIIALILAVLAAFGIQIPDWLTSGKPPATARMERAPATTPVTPPGDLPRPGGTRAGHHPSHAARRPAPHRQYLHRRQADVVRAGVFRSPRHVLLRLRL